MKAIRRTKYVYVVGYNDNAMGELVRSEQHFNDFAYALDTAIDLLNRCDHVLIFAGDEEVPYVISTLNIVPKGTIIINRKD